MHVNNVKLWEVGKVREVGRFGERDGFTVGRKGIFAR